MATDCDAMLKGVLMSPADDLPRLVLADWLEERGQEDRAEFIRVQCEIARLEESGEACEIDPDEGHTCCEEPCPVCRSVEEYVQLEQRAVELLGGDYGRNWRHWAGAAIELIPNGAYYYDHLTFRGRFVLTFCRGFVAEVTCTAEDWLANADALYWHPEQTVDCERCGGTGIRGWVTAIGCKSCGGGRQRQRGHWQGTGRVPRPFPGGGVQPLTDVRLTTWLEPYAWELRGSDTRFMRTTFTHSRWPGITFHRPGSNEANQ